MNPADSKTGWGNMLLASNILWLRLKNEGFRPREVKYDGTFTFWDQASRPTEQNHSKSEFHLDDLVVLLLKWLPIPLENLYILWNYLIKRNKKQI